MDDPMRNDWRRRGIFPLICSMALTLFAVWQPCWAPPSAHAASAQELRLGERIYRDGILPSGERLQATLKGGKVIPGMTFTCASCHLRSGLGSYDDGIYVPAITGKKLFEPLEWRYKGIYQRGSLAATQQRPAYTDESLGEAIRHGRSCNGTQLADGMPRYQFEPRDWQLLLAYLRTLSTEFSPGVTEDSIRFATVVSETVPSPVREAMLSRLSFFFKLKKGQIRGFKNPRSGAKSRLMAQNMFSSRELADKSVSLATWTLKGPAESWPAQLEQYSRRDSVFALLGGVVRGPWQPIHRFCEEHAIPCIFPNSDLPVISDTDWYTLYQSKGYYQEGEQAARFLNDKEDLLGRGRVVQVVRATPQAQALAAGFQRVWQECGRKPPVSVPLARGKALDREFLKELLAPGKTAVLLVWDDAGALPGLQALADRTDRPESLFLSGRYLGDSIWSLGEGLRSFSFLTYPYTFSPPAPPAMGRVPVHEDTLATLRQRDLPLRGEIQKIAAETDALTLLLTQMLMDLDGNYYRDSLLDVLGMMSDQSDPLYGRLNFGTGQRYSAQGCYIVQLTSGGDPELVKRSGWIIR